MKFKLSFFVFLFLILIFSITTIFASDVDNDTICVSDNNLDETVLANENSTEVLNNQINDYNIESSDLTIYYKSNTLFKASLKDSNGSGIANKSITIFVNGKNYIKTTDKNGLVKLKISFKPGKYQVRVVYNDNKNIKTTVLIKVLTTIKANNLYKIYKDPKKFTATFLKANGSPLSNKYIKFKVNGKTYKVKTNSKGVATLKINLKKGSYKIISYNTDKLSKINKIKVYRKSNTKIITSAYTFLKSEKKIIKVKLVNNFDYGVGYKIIKIKINGKSYSKKTNSNGVAYFKLPKLNKGHYDIKYRFSGKGAYSKSFASSKVIIIPSKVSKISIKSTTIFGHGAKTPFKLQLQASGVNLYKKTISLKINNKKYKLISDEKGFVSLPINLNIGDYNVSYLFKGDLKVNPCSGKIQIHVKKRIDTTIYWNFTKDFNHGLQIYRIFLSDSNFNKVVGKTINVFVDGERFTAKTDSKGYANIYAHTSVGSHSVKFAFNGDNTHKSSNNVKIIKVSKKTIKGCGYWIFGSDMNKVSLSKLASKGTKDIFLNSHAFSIYGKAKVISWIKKANKKGIRVHIWMQAFYNGKWISPLSSYSPNQGLFNKITKEAKSYAKIDCVAGVHFDYLRYPGNAYKHKGGVEAINKFVRQVSTEIHKTNSKCLVSAAIMPETSSNRYYYGQDMNVLGKYLDIVIPMIYKGNYGKNSKWIKTTAKYFVKNSKGANIWGGIQSYYSDSNVKKLPYKALTADCKATTSSGASGVVLFRWGITNFLNLSKFL